MKYLWLALLTLSLSSSLVGCNKKKSGASVTRDQGLRVTPEETGGVTGDQSQSGGSSVTGTGAWGKLVAESYYQSQFNDAVYGLVSASDLSQLNNTPANLGTVSSQWTASTGVFFSSADGPRNPIAVLSGDASIRISDIQNSSIPDTGFELGSSSLSMEVKGSGGIVGLVFSSAVSGRVSGDRAEIHFEDEYGSIIFSGNVYVSNGEYFFSGRLNFENNITYDGRVRSGSIDFKIYACSFFKCTN